MKAERNLRLWLGKEKIVKHVFNSLPEYIATYEMANGWPVVTVRSAKEEIEYLDRLDGEEKNMTKIQFERPGNRSVKTQIPIFNFKATEPIAPTVHLMDAPKAIYTAWHLEKSPLGYCGYRQLKKHLEFGYHVLFGLLKWLYQKDPYCMRFGVSRSGKNVYLQILRKEAFFS